MRLVPTRQTGEPAAGKPRSAIAPNGRRRAPAGAVRLVGAALVLLAARTSVRADADSTFFPLPRVLAPNVEFWVRIYTRYSIHEYLILDAGNVDRVYAVIDLRERFAGKAPSPKQKSDFIGKEKEKIASRLKSLGQGGFRNRALSKEDRALVRLFGDSAQAEDLLRAAEQVRVQNGCREQFEEGLVRSGRYLDSLRALFRRAGLPEDLACLPHVESSFNPLAGSRAGAVGMWQFIRSTGQVYLRINDAFDDRKDPYLSTAAAIRLLKLNHDHLGNWPLAITAYNHGVLGLRQIMRDLGTDDLGDIVSRYDSQRFGFASKNFYAEFLAAVRVAQQPLIHFGYLQTDPPLRFKTVVLPVGLPFDAAAESFGVAPETLAELNPAFNGTLLRGLTDIPSRYALRVPEGSDEAAAFSFLVSGGYLPRGAYLAWCPGMEKTLLRFVGEL